MDRDIYKNEQREGKDEIRTQFLTREGTYQVSTVHEYSRPKPNYLNSSSNGSPTFPCRISTIALDKENSVEYLAFNVGKEMYCYPFHGCKKPVESAKPTDRRVYKSTYPTCHDFNSSSLSNDSVQLLIGFSEGQIQLINPVQKNVNQLYNEDRQIDDSKVTCIKWTPGSSTRFLVAYTSGNLYDYNIDLECCETKPQYQLFKSSDELFVYTCRTKPNRNPLFRWSIGSASGMNGAATSNGTSGGSSTLLVNGNSAPAAINEFTFSPDAKHLALVSQDGFLRVVEYDRMESVVTMRSYFGGLLCVCWSPDGRYIVTGGEDDLITVFSFQDRRVICRGHGHSSWVNAVAFDPFTSHLAVAEMHGFDHSFSEEDVRSESHTERPLSGISFEAKLSAFTTYRLGSVGQDTQLCLWDLTEDVLRPPGLRSRAPTNSTSQFANHCESNAASSTSSSIALMPAKFATLSIASESGSTANTASKKADKEHRRNFSLGLGKNDKSSSVRTPSVYRTVDDTVQYLGTPLCPRMDEVPVLEPLICKKVSFERLNSVIFREDSLLVACQEGIVYTWLRPDKLSQPDSPDSPSKEEPNTVV